MTTLTLRDMGFLGATQTPWTPASIATSLWLDASDSSTIILNSNAVSQWSDKSGNSRHAFQSTAANRPTVQLNSLNSLPGILFDGVNDFLAFASPIVGATHSLFILFKMTQESAFGVIFGQWAANQTGRYMWVTNQSSAGVVSSGTLNVFNSTATSGAGSFGFATGVSVLGNAVIIGSVSQTGSEQWKLIKDGTEWDSATITSVYQGVNSSLGSINASATAEPYDGLIYEVISLSSYADTDTRQRIEGYLAHKWSLTAKLPNNHPYKNSPPTV